MDLAEDGEITDRGVGDIFPWLEVVAGGPGEVSLGPETEREVTATKEEIILAEKTCLVTSVSPVSSISPGSRTDHIRLPGNNSSRGEIFQRKTVIILAGRRRNITTVGHQVGNIRQTL